MFESSSITPGAGGDSRRRFAKRLTAALLHLGLSGLVAAAAALLVFLVWYPTPYREISGGRDLFLLVVAVDVILGPLITFAIFDVRKGSRELRRDLAVVVLLQLAALGYGMHTVYLARPVYLVFEVDRFRVVRAADVDPAALARAVPGLRRLPVFGPELLSARVPTDPDERMQSISLALGGLDVGMRPEWWQDYALARDDVRQRAMPLQPMRSRPERVSIVDAAVAACGRPVGELGTIPILARLSSWSAVVDRSDATVCAYLPFGGFDAP